jgi:hypothetical protein
VFIDEAVQLGVSLSHARGRLDDCLRLPAILQRISSTAFTDGLSTLLVAGMPRPAYGVQARSLPPHWHAGTVVVPIRWTTDPATEELPPLDANLELGPSPDDACQLALRGIYRPPRAAFDAMIDRAILYAAARSTGCGLLAGLASTLAPEGNVTNRLRTPVSGAV